MENVNITINGKQLQVPSNYTVLQAAKSANIHIPTLCYLEGVNQLGACRMCLVEINGTRGLQASCVYPVNEGMVVQTNTPTIREARKVTLELILSNHDRKCLTCTRNQNCELQKLAEELNIQDIRFEGEQEHYHIDDFSPSIVRDPNKCILCRRCISACKNLQAVSAIETMNRGFKSVVGTPYNKKLSESDCVGCGQCITACPVGALREKDDTDKVWKAIADPELHVVVQTAPAIRVALGEEFGMPIGSNVTGKMVSALRQIGFDKVFDTDVAADLTIMEEGTELINRIKNGGKLPLITSCSPGWINFAEKFYADFLDNLSTCKSPHMMLGAIIKTYYAQKMNIDPAKIFVVSIMPCTAKKYEIQRPEMNSSGFRDVDVSLTTREAAKMIKEGGVDFINIEDSDFDNPLGESTGAGLIFGATGGVMEAALRTVAEILGTDNPSIEYKDVRGIEGIKEAEVQVGGMTIRAAVAHGLANARKLLEQVKSGEKQYHFIEIMACPGGCVTGGGQPIVSAQDRMGRDISVERAKAIYSADEKAALRKSHESPVVKTLYSEYFEEPGSHKSHELLHTHYHSRVEE